MQAQQAGGEKKSYQVPWWRTSFGDAEVQELLRAISGEHISQGLVTAKLEAQIAEALEVPYTVVTTSGSVALLLALMALGIGRDDEVIVPNRTWIATAHAVLLLGGKATLVDVRSDIPAMDISQVRRKITPKTKAIIPVHLGGRAVDMEEVDKISKEYGLFVIEDASQALFCKNQHGYLGTLSDAGCFSLSITKLISTGQGGFIVTRSKDTYEKLKLARSHGVSDVIDVKYTQMGFNFKFTDLQAAIGLAQLSRVERNIAHIHKVYAKYAEGLREFPFLELIPVNVSGGEIPLYVEVLCDKREKLMKFLAARGIQTRPFYPDLDRASYLKNSDDFPRSRRFSQRGVFLPCGPEQPLENVDHVLEALRLYRYQKQQATTF